MKSLQSIRGASCASAKQAAWSIQNLISSLSIGKPTANTVPSLFRWAAGKFSDNSEWRDQGGKEKRPVSKCASSYASCLPRGIQSYQSESFLPRDTYPSNACSPVLSLTLSILYFPPLIDRKRPLMLLSPAYVHSRFSLFHSRSES